MKRLIFMAAVLAVAALAPTAGAKPDEPNPSQFCRDVLPVVDPEASEFLGTGGGCVSSVASVGIEALMQGAFPSNAAAVENCKTLERTDFMAPGEPNPGGPYPYQFYWFLGDQLPAELQAQLLAQNRADCVRLLRFFHGGGLGG